MKKLNKNKLITVKSLRQAGHKIRCTHHRRFVPVSQLNDMILIPSEEEKRGGIHYESQGIEYKMSSRGGSTSVECDLKNGKYYRADSLVSNNDYYSKSRGLRIVMGRLQKQLRENGEVI